MISEWLDQNQLREKYPQVSFGDNVTVGLDVEIGEDCKIGSGVRIYTGTKIGSLTTVLENTVIGRPTLLPKTTVVKRKLSQVPPTQIGKDCVIGASVVLYEGAKIGNQVIICDLTSVREHCILGDSVLLGRSVTVQVNTQIGDRTKIMDACHLPGDMIIESDVFLSAHVCGASENSLGRSDTQPTWSGPHIKKGAYLGLNCTLLPNLSIGEHSVVAAGAVVTKSVPDFTLVMGAPARPVRKVDKRPDVN